MIIGIPKSVACLPVSAALAFIRSRLVSFAAAALRLTLRPSTSPVQPLLFASAMRSLRFAMISVNLLRALGSSRKLGQRIHACSCLHGVPYGRPHVPSSSFLSSKCCWNSLHSSLVGSRYSASGLCWRRVSRKARYVRTRNSQILWIEGRQATSDTGVSGDGSGVMSTGRSRSLPWWNTAPARTNATRCGALTARHRDCAASISL